MEHVSEIIDPIVARLGRKVATYQAYGARVLNRAGAPHWMSIEEAEREGFRLTAQLMTADDPGEVLPRVTQLAWAIRDAREASTDPQPPANDAAMSKDAA